jgi:hypothetical protein
LHWTAPEKNEQNVVKSSRRALGHAATGLVQRFAPELDPAREDYASFANFSEPDGNSWML